MSMERKARECEWISETAGVRSTERSSHEKQQTLLVAMRPGETPVPIPNTTVKTRAAENTMPETVWKDRRPPASLQQISLQYKSSESSAGGKTKSFTGDTS